MHVGILLKIEVSSREFRKQGNICMGKIGYPFFCFVFVFVLKKKGNLSVPIFRTCAVLLSFLDDGVGGSQLLFLRSFAFFSSTPPPPLYAPATWASLTLKWHSTIFHNK